MKFHIIAGHIILALSLTAGHAVSAQDYSNTPVNISKEKVKVNGTVCYSHVVLERQTLFSISKAYNVSIEDLYKYNPSVKEKGLIKNSIIIIPVVEAPVQEVKVEEVRNAADPQMQEPSSEPKKKKKSDMSKDDKKAESLADKRAKELYRYHLEKAIGGEFDRKGFGFDF